jgi:hypothetical protein
MKKVLIIITFLTYTLKGISQNVGIGTTNPIAKLDVMGGVKIADSINIAGQIRMTNGTPGAGKVLTSDSTGLASWEAPALPVSHFIGESYGGGIVFYVYDNGKHGLIAATADQSTGIQWYSGAFTVTNAIRNGINAGKSNTARLITSQGVTAYAAQICANYQGGNYGDWYLPSIYELDLLCPQKNVVGGFASVQYWSSTEIDSYSVWNKAFGNTCRVFVSNPNANFNVRAIRSF